MNSDKARDALSQCLHIIFKTNGKLWGYRYTADRLCRLLSDRGFVIISKQTYARLLERIGIPADISLVNRNHMENAGDTSKDDGSIQEP